MSRFRPGPFDDDDCDPLWEDRLMAEIKRRRDDEFNRVHPFAVPDDLRRAVLCQMDYSPEVEALIQARGSQIKAARAEAQRWNGYYSGTGQRWPGLAGQRWPGLAGRNTTVRRVLRQVMSDHHAIATEALDFVDPRLPVAGSCGSPPPIPFDEGNIDHTGSAVYGLVAGEPLRVHILRAGYTPDRWLAELTQTRHRQCAWKADVCLGYSAGEVMAFASGPFLLAIPTCQACKQSLTRNFSVA